MNPIETRAFVKYTDDVLEYLEYLGYPEYVRTYDPEQVARSMHGAIRNLYEIVSYRFCALTIFGATMEYQVMRKGQTIN